MAAQVRRIFVVLAGSAHRKGRKKTTSVCLGEKTPCGDQSSTARTLGILSGPQAGGPHPSHHLGFQHRMANLHPEPWPTKRGTDPVPAQLVSSALSCLGAGHPQARVPAALRSPPYPAPQPSHIPKEAAVVPSKGHLHAAAEPFPG